MRFDVRGPKRHVSSIEFDRWYNGGRKIKSMPDKICRIRKHIKFERIVYKSALYGPLRGMR